VIKQVHVLRTKQPAPDRLDADGSGPGLTDPAGVGYRQAAAVIDVETSQLQNRNRRNSSWLQRLRRILDGGCSESSSASDVEAAGCAHAPRAIVVGSCLANGGAGLRSLVGFDAFLKIMNVDQSPIKRGRI
jgi:hypothetical protein